MFNSTSSEVWTEKEYNEATSQNLYLLLQTERGELECDPYFGLLLKHYMFNQNSYVLTDILIDTIYTQLAIFLPQVKVKRDSIKIIRDEKLGRVYCKFSGINQIDYTHNSFNLVLFEESNNI
jgi:hypothetical protein